MSLSTKLEAMLGADVAMEVINIINSKDSMKKYLATDKGKAARKRANQTFLAKHGRRRYESDTKENVHDFLVSYVNDASEHSIELDLHRTGSQLWKAYQDNSHSRLTRVRFLTLLPEMKINPYIMREGKKVYTPAYVIPFMDYNED